MTTTPDALERSADPDNDEAGTLSGLRQSAKERVAIALFIGVPFIGLLAAVPVAWGWGLGWHDLVIAAGMYAISGHGVTVGFHRFFTHGSFKAPKALRVAMAIAGSLAVQGPVIR